MMVRESPLAGAEEGLCWWAGHAFAAPTAVLSCYRQWLCIMQSLLVSMQVLDGSMPPPPAYKVTATSVANKGEPFISGIPNSREAVQTFLDSIALATSSTAAAETPTAADPAATAAAAGADAAAVSGGKVCWRVVDYMGPKEVRMKQAHTVFGCHNGKQPPLCHSFCESLFQCFLTVRTAVAVSARSLQAAQPDIWCAVHFSVLTG